MLAEPEASAPGVRLVEWNLQRDVGMTCGGVVKLFFETYNHSQWQIAIFGAGHVAAAVVHCLLPLECRVTCIDPREEWLDRLAVVASRSRRCKPTTRRRTSPRCRPTRSSCA